MFEKKDSVATEKFLTLASFGSKDLVWTFFLTLCAAFFPALLAHAPQNQWVTGTIVNAIIFFSAWRVGLANTAVVAILPSSIALLRGLLPPPMALMVPFIIAANFLLIIFFISLRKYPLFSVIISSSAKFALLSLVTLSLAKLPPSIAYMMQWPQLATALAGGLIALGAIKLMKGPRQS